MTNGHKILIRPDDCIADIDEFADGSEPRSRCRYYIEPYWLYQLQVVDFTADFTPRSLTTCMAGRTITIPITRHICLR